MANAYPSQKLTTNLINDAPPRASGTDNTPQKWRSPGLEGEIVLVLDDSEVLFGLSNLGLILA